MRIDNNLRKSVLFIGHGEGDEFKAAGTGFTLTYDGFPYLATARHVVEELGGDPYAFRMNRAGGGAAVLHWDDLDPDNEPKVRWFFHRDPSVDVALLPFPLDYRAADIEFVVIRAAHSVPDKPTIVEAGCGDLCYAVGLFSRHQGTTRNLPVVHTGHIALMPNKLDKVVCRGLPTEAFLVEIANLQGLSGAPVFVRQATELAFSVGGSGAAYGILPSNDLRLLGVWSSSFEGYSDARLRVPVGIGIVTPAAKLLELLGSEEVAANRDEWLAAVRSKQENVRP